VYRIRVSKGVCQILIVVKVIAKMNNAQSALKPKLIRY